MVTVYRPSLILTLCRVVWTEMGRLLHWMLLYQALSSAGAFFVDTACPIIFQNEDPSFGHQVVQMDKWVIVSAPLHRETENKTGQLYRCDPQTANCNPIPGSFDDDINSSLGLSLTVQESPPQLLVCGQTLQRTCGGNIYVTGRCYYITGVPPVMTPLPRSLPECSVRGLDIVFLIDGSGSIRSTDFKLMLNFVTKVMEEFKETNTQFALLQYSHIFRIHFDFNQFSQIREPKQLTWSIVQQGGGTHTSTAILMVMQNLFGPGRGVRDNTEKVLIVITDGQSVRDKTPFSQSIGEADRLGVRRFVIGVGDAFSVPSAYNELVTIASPKAEDHLLRVNDFSILQTFQRTLQEKIFEIEGTQAANGSSFQLEMSQEVFNAVLTPRGPIPGAEGVYDWSGGISLNLDGQQNGTWINVMKDRTDMKDSYMDYAVQQVQWDTLAIGAPRYQHLGSVFIYKNNPTTSEWSQVASFTADKIGSYFGSVLSVLALNLTHSLLVVGAPKYYSPEAPGGRVYLCPVTEVRNFGHPKGPSITMTCPEALQGDPSQSVGHFGSAISILPDMTGDQLPDLAVGAPYEDNYQGAVYIFPGQGESFRTSYIQRIPGRQVSGGIKYFGRSLSGNLDMTRDNLPDLVVGGEGRVLIMRSRPVLGVSVVMTFDPTEIPLSFYECSDQRKVGSVIKLTVCFFSYKKNNKATVEDFGQVTYSLLLDAGRTNTRALFSGAGNSINATKRLLPGEVCADHSIQIPECVEDPLSALRVSLNFSLVGTPVLSEDSPSDQSAEVPFQKNCGVSQVMVGETLDVNVRVSLQNEALSSAGAFFVDTACPIIFQNEDPSFGHQVVQMDKWVIVSAPLHRETENKTGQLYRCDPQTANCNPIPGSFDDDINSSLGLSLTVQESPPQLLVCGPTLQRTCGGNIYVTGRCYYITGEPPVMTPLPRSLPECSVRGLDIVFLIDGSGSIRSTDFTLMLNFVTKVMEEFKETNTQFALLQYSHIFRIHFDFNQFSQIREPKQLTWSIVQQKGGTHTSTAILMVMQNLFGPGRGVRDNTKKVLIVITDGQSVRDRTPFSQSIGEADRLGVRRFVIGVGDAFSVPSAYNELVTIASPKAEDHLLRVNDFSILQTFQRTLQEKIFEIEGAWSANGSSFQLEMSQEVFNAVLTPRGPIPGAEGVYDWSGGISLNLDGQQNGTWINVMKDRTDMKDSYMDYAVQQVQWDTLAIGTPRYQHLGSVFIYKNNPTTSEWSQVASFTADKIGSYFGSVLSVLALNLTHSLLVVGAPKYYSPEAPGGRVYLCPVTEVRNFWHPKGPSITMTCPETLQGDPSQSVGRFGSAISILPDMTGDQLPDLAVGAPYEDNYQGAVYIFPGQGESFRTSYIQRISGRQVSGGIKYFGRSLSGNLDMTRDNLPDLVVGGEGRVLIMRSRPVLGVSVVMTFDPTEIPLSFYECSDQRKVGSVIKLTVCFFSYKKNNKATVEDFGQVTYSLLLDAGRTNTRALFTGYGRSLNATKRIMPGEVCEDHSFQIPECVEDPLSALRVSLNFSLVGTPVLSEDSPSDQSAEVPFQKNCGGDGVCEDDRSQKITFKRNYRQAPSDRKMSSSQLSVRYAIYVTITSLEESTKYQNFFGGDSIIQHIYRVTNLGQRSLPLTVIFMVPVRVGETSIWETWNITSSKPDITCTEAREAPGAENYQEILAKTPILNCSVGWCVRVECQIRDLEVQSSLNFTISGSVTKESVTQTGQQKIFLQTTAEFRYDSQTYAHILEQNQRFVRTQYQNLLENLDEP